MLFLIILPSGMLYLTMLASRLGVDNASNRIRSFEEGELASVATRQYIATSHPTHLSTRWNTSEPPHKEPLSNPFNSINNGARNGGTNWKDFFCRDFFSNRFTVNMTPCAGQTERVNCYGSPHDDKMGSCVIQGLAMDTAQFYQIMFEDKDSVKTSHSLWLDSKQLLCPEPNFSLMEKKMVGGDYVKRLAETAVVTTPQSRCGKWINGTTFIFMGFDDHIYFKYLSWFSLHNGINNHKSITGSTPSLIIRIPELKGNYTHIDYEQRLFPETTLLSLKEFSQQNKGTVCFEKVVITPWAYSTNVFRCKMSDSARRLRNKCYSCNGNGLTSTPFMTFRRRALAACSIIELTSAATKPPQVKDIVLQVRKPYIRRLGDSLKRFNRVMANPEEVVEGLKSSFPGANVHVMVAEDMSLCDQLRMVYNTDVLIGIHGAGLVHLWWLQDHALLFEIVPPKQKSNPSFKMLATVTGRRYYGYERLKRSEKSIILDVNEIVAEIKAHF